MFGIGQVGRLGIAGSLWNESALWPQGASSPGLWIDPPYAASEFQESTGVTPLSAIGTVLDSSNPIGLILDRKGGLQLGSELFSLSTPTIVNVGGCIGAYANGTISNTAIGSNGGFPRFQFSTPCTAGKRYLVSGQITGDKSAVSQVRLSAGGGETVPYNQTTGIFYGVVIALNSALEFSTNGATLFNATITNISVREIPGISLSQATSAARPVASARKNLLVGTATLSTQSVTVTAIPHTITFSGGGTITASGTYTGALTSGQAFTPTAGSLTLTVSGSVTLAQLERGSATRYQAVVSASDYDTSDYDTSGFPVFAKLDGTDDGLASATFAAGTLTSSMDCLIAVRRDSAAAIVCGLYETSGAATKYLCLTQSGEVGSTTPAVAAGTATTYYVDGSYIGDHSTSSGTMHTALTVGAWHVLEVRGLNLSAWTAIGFGGYVGFSLNGALGGIQLFASGQGANRDKARARMAAYFGVTLA